MSEEINGRAESCDENTEAPDTSKGELRHRYEEALAQLCLIERMNEQINLLDDMPSLCLSIVQTVLEFTVAENCSIMLNDPSSGDLRLFVAKGKGDRGSHIGSDRMETAILTSGEGIAGLAAETGEIICVDDCEADGRFVDLKTAAKTVRSLVSAPIVSDDTVLGVMNCSHSIRKQFKEIDKLNISLVADHAAILLQRAMAAERAVQKLRALEKQVKDKTKSIEENLASRAEMREQLYKSEKFVTLGEMLAGVAHELNNRVAPILIYSQMLQQSTDNEQDSKRLRIVEDSAKGAKAILETLLTYSHEGTSEHKEAVNLNKILQNALTLTEYKVRNQGVELIVDLSPQLPPAEVNEMQMAQVFLNIINNALHAMESEGGKLLIRSECEGANISVTIADSGAGIPDEIAARIFTPFFTTKEAGKGTGLGLSISKRYIEENGGGIRIEDSTLGGAAFVIEVPGLEVKSIGADNRAFSATSATVAVATAGAKILVVDDDSTICDVIRDILGPGYQVEFASDGNVATKKIGSDPFDLLLVDYHMPGLDGKQLYEWIVGNHPAMSNRVVFSTGDIFHNDIREFIDSTGCNCLIKPFTTKNLREVVTGALGAKREGLHNS